MELERNTSARDAILGRSGSICRRANLLTRFTLKFRKKVQPLADGARPCVDQPLSLIEVFKQRLEEVGGHCIVAGHRKESWPH